MKISILTSHTDDGEFGCAIVIEYEICAIINS